MRLHEDVLRYMTVRVDTLEEGPSAMLQGRGERGERGERGRRRDGEYDDDRGERRPRESRGFEGEPRSDEGRAE
jgi:small subunit ribosomal protein S6